jgi:ABC-type phosphate/phosphonate transport system substrate-binding protein
MRYPLRVLIIVVVGLVGLQAGIAPGARAGDVPLRVGIAETFFRDVPKGLVKTVTQPFVAVLHDTVGLKGELITGDDAFSVAKQLSNGALQIAVFHGFEYAWVHQQHAELRPLMVAVNSKQSTQAYIIVRKEGAPASFADLTGKEFALPKRTKEHCRLFVERQCQGNAAHAAKEFFAQVNTPANVETALDELGKGKYQAAVIDTHGLEFYKDLKPGSFARLKILAQSEVFPPLVVAYKQGALDAATLARICNGLRATSKTEMGREMLKIWGITAFEPVPDMFAQTLTASLKAYPMPDAKK